MIPGKETAGDALAAWDAGEIVWSVEMGGTGLGAAYEQCIQLLAFELIRPWAGPAGKPPPPRPTWEDFRAKGNEVVREVNKWPGCGFSGAQVGAANTIAWRALRDGWDKMVESAPEDRHTQVSKAWPHKPEEMT